jgi:hypothetical protein
MITSTKTINILLTEDEANCLEIYLGALSHGDIKDVLGNTQDANAFNDLSDELYKQLSQATA